MTNFTLVHVCTSLQLATGSKQPDALCDGELCPLLYWKVCGLFLVKSGRAPGRGPEGSTGNSIAEAPGKVARQRAGVLSKRGHFFFLSAAGSGSAFIPLGPDSDIRLAK